MRRMTDLPVRLATVLTALMGVVNVLSALTPPFASRLKWLSPWSPLAVREGGRLAAAVSGFALLQLALGLSRRKRTAWVLTLLVLAVSAVSHVVKGLDFEEAVIAGALAMYLFASGAHFHARSDPPSVRRAGRVLLAATVFTVLYGSLGFWLLDRQLHAHFDVWLAVKQTLLMLTQFRSPQFPGATRFGRWFVTSVFTVGIATGAWALSLMLRPVLLRAPATREDRDRARTIVEAFGRSSLARFTLLEDKAYFFSPGGSVVSFVVKAGVAVSLGDPMCPNRTRVLLLSHSRASASARAGPPRSTRSSRTLSTRIGRPGSRRSASARRPSCAPRRSPWRATRTGPCGVRSTTSSSLATGPRCSSLRLRTGR
jgi:phosphatidylglycerol lysyltransferase